MLRIRVECSESISAIVRIAAAISAPRVSSNSADSSQPLLGEKRSYVTRTLCQGRAEKSPKSARLAAHYRVPGRHLGAAASPISELGTCRSWRPRDMAKMFAFDKSFADVRFDTAGCGEARDVDFRARIADDKQRHDIFGNSAMKSRAVSVSISRGDSFEERPAMCQQRDHQKVCLLGNRNKSHRTNEQLRRTPA